ncbi:dockerin type I domain-containing protein [Candidatus Bathyarchaeota archaeon]|nr:dockerin type I domain-containing protein [Candidatus Bathyarchaeota archaeon]
MEAKDQVSALVLTAVILVSILFTSLPLVHADYVVDHASFPPDLPGDVTYDGTVNVKDVALVAKAYGSWFPDHGLWNARADVNDDGKVDVKDVSSVAKLFSTVYDTSTTPIAYSKSFEFGVPNTGFSGVWYYLLARIYMPSSFLSNTCFLVGSGYEIGHVVIDTNLTGSTGYGSFNISLGNLTQGYHLLQLTYLAPANGDTISFIVITSAGEPAWLDRFRIYVPNFINVEVRYTVKTETYFPGDTFFLGSSANQHLYVDDFIDDVYVDVGLIWQDWMWDMGVYGAIYAWGDGFMYPLGWQSDWHSITFTFGNKGYSGLLDFLYVSWTNQPAKIGPPKFYASANTENLGNDITLNGGSIYGNSQWASEPGISERNTTILTAYNVSYSDGNNWFNTCLEVTLGNWWAMWSLSSGPSSDVGIPLNFTVANFTSNLPTGLYMGTAFWWTLYFKDLTIDTYSFTDLTITGMEVPAHDIITPEFTIATDFAGITMMTAGALIPGGLVIGSVVGLGVIGVAGVLDYYQGQQVSDYDQTITQANHWQLKSKEPVQLDGQTDNWSESESDLVFLGLRPTGGKHCGSTKVVLKATLQASYWCGLSSVPLQNYPVGDIEITLCIPWFIWP